MEPDGVSDRLELSELLDRYAAAVDERDWDGIRDAFTSDATVDFTSAGGPKGSIDDIVGWLEQVLGAFASSQHLVTNRRLTVDGDEATGHAYLFNPMIDADGNTMLFGGAYRDRFRRTPDGWRICDRTFEMSWSGRLA